MIKILLMSNPKIKVGILYGGRSVEHGVSINSARNIFKYIDTEQYEPIAIGITQEGKWFLNHDINKEIHKGIAIAIELDATHPVLRTADNTKLYLDIIFPVLHGTDGEDGSIQGMFKAMNVPIVGTSVLGSAISMNKILSKKILASAGIPVVPFLHFHFTDKAKINFEFISNTLGLPFMVKAANLGSSVGVTKVKAKADFEQAIEEAFRFDEEILFESFIKGREIECAILGNEPPQASLPGEIIISSNYEFYTFDAKYVDSEAVEIKVPAELSEDISKKIREVSVASFRALYCQDFARVDLFLTEGGKVYVNEINTIPGFTNASMYPMMWNERGIGFTELISELISIAQKRNLKSKRASRDFKSSLKY